MAVSASLLPFLEPYLSIGFALNVAYLGLQRFRYRVMMREHAAKGLAELNGNSDFKETDWYQRVRYLSEKADESDPSAPIPTANFPKEHWAISYRLLFANGLDRKVCSFSALAAAALVFFGVGHQVGALNDFWLVGPSSSGFILLPIWFWYWLSLAISAGPVFFVWSGGTTVFHACAYVDEQISNMKKMLQANARSAPEPVLK